MVLPVGVLAAEVHAARTFRLIDCPPFLLGRLGLVWPDASLRSVAAPLDDGWPKEAAVAESRPRAVSAPLLGAEVVDHRLNVGDDLIRVNANHELGRHLFKDCR